MGKTTEILSGRPSEKGRGGEGFSRAKSLHGGYSTKAEEMKTRRKTLSLVVKEGRYEPYRTYLNSSNKKEGTSLTIRGACLFRIVPGETRWE